MQHLQGYASVLASLPQTTHLPVPYPNLSPHLNGIQQQAYTNIYNISPTQSSSSPAPSHPQSPTSPQQSHSSPLSPFTAYPSSQLSHSNNNNTSNSSHHHPKHTKPQQQPATSTPNSHLFSLFFPGTGPGAASGSRSG